MVANKYLPAPLQLNPEKVDLLTSRGFDAPTDEGNFQREVAVDNFQEILNVVKEIFQLFQEIYGLDALPHFKLTISLD